MTDSRHWQPAGDEAPHAIPMNAAVLAASRKHAMPEPPHLEAKEPQRRLVHGYTVIADVSTHHCLQPLAQCGDRFMHAPPKFGFHRIQFCLQPFANRLPQHRVHSVASLLYADMRKAEEVECFRPPFTTPLPVIDRKPTKLQQSCFLGMQFQMELPHSFPEFCPKLIGLRFALESKHNVVGETHHDDVAVRSLSSPCLGPQVKYVMEVDVCQKRRCTSALRRPLLHSHSLSILQHARVQPFLGDPIEKTFYVKIEHPVHLLRQQSRVECIQRLMLAAPGSEPVRKIEEIRFVDGIQHFHRRALYDLVFQRCDSERSLPPVGLGDVYPTHRLGSVCSAFQSMGKVLEVLLEGLAVVPPCLSVHARRGFLLQREVSQPQRFQMVDMVQERRESQLLILLCCLTYPLQRTARVFPARCPGRVLLGQVPFGQTVSLRSLRCQLPGIVRELLRYFRSVRLPRPVHHRRTSLDVPMRPMATTALGGPGISRFPREVLPYVLGVCDRAGLPYTSRYRCTGWGLPLSPTASASRRKGLSRLYTRPARSPVNASTPPSRAAPHDSGPMWVAISHSYDSFIHYTSPV